MIWPGIAVLAFITLQRLAELALSQRNKRRLLARGAYEVASGHYPFMVLLHGSWLAVLWFLGPGPPIEIIPLILFALLQLGRIWVIATLGERWTTRIIVLPGAPLVKTGPYRWFNHPNYLIVIGEFAVLPLVFGLPMVAIVFSVLNGLLLWVRIRDENKALGR
ncbi:MAG TPA: isoprenylcysteine carboxylmethyltransferase family protein [Sphingomicrobium sp.]|nr:isoprenylcysteine carboxylmethyltransferase family protein [Sphingomicrobium sp.]